MTTLDIVVVILFLGVVFFVGLRHSHRKESDAGSYFLAGRSLGWLVLGMSFAGSDLLGALCWNANSGTQSLLPVRLDLASVFVLLIIGLFVYPRLRSLDIVSVPDFLSRRFDRGIGAAAAVFNLTGIVVVRIALTLILGMRFLEEPFGLGTPGILAAIVMVAGLPAIIGGFAPSAYIRRMCTIAAVWGFAVLIIAGYMPAGGRISDLLQPLFNIDGTHWLVLTAALPLFAFWFWGSDQFSVHHVFAARSAADVRHGAVGAVAAKVLVIVLAVLAGAGASAAAVHPAAGVRGAAVIPVLGAMIASLAGAFSSAASVVALDLYKPLRPESATGKLVLIGRLAATAAMILAILWIPLARIAGAGTGLFLLTLLMCTAGPAAALMAAGLLWPRAESAAVRVGLAAGAAGGVLRLGAELGGVSALPAAFGWFLGSPYLLTFLHLFLLTLLATAVCVFLKPAARREMEQRGLQYRAGINVHDTKTDG